MSSSNKKYAKVFWGRWTALALAFAFIWPAAAQPSAEETEFPVPEFWVIGPAEGARLSPPVVQNYRAVFDDIEGPARPKDSVRIDVAAQLDASGAVTGLEYRHDQATELLYNALRRDLLDLKFSPAAEDGRAVACVAKLKIAFLPETGRAILLWDPPRKPVEAFEEEGGEAAPDSVQRNRRRPKRPRLLDSPNCRIRSKNIKPPTNRTVR